MQLSDGVVLPDRLRVTEGSKETAAEARITILTRIKAKAGIDNVWWPAVAHLDTGVTRHENDRGWRWRKDIGTLKSNAGKFGFAWAAEIADTIHGAILYRLGGVSTLDLNLPTLDVWRLATAPWNREWLQQPRYKGVGHGLLRLAVFHSWQYGLAGRVTLQAYNDQRLVDWYRDFGFELVSTDEDGINTLELVPEAAARHLPPPAVEP